MSALDALIETIYGERPNGGSLEQVAVEDGVAFVATYSTGKVERFRPFARPGVLMPKSWVRTLAAKVHERLTNERSCHSCLEGQ